MVRSMSKKPGDYPEKCDNQTIQKKKVLLGNKSILLTEYVSDRSINIHIGGKTKWCIHCEVIKKDGSIQSNGYLIKVRYDNLCSLDSIFKRGFDTKQLIYFLIQYIHDTYPSVQELQFNDLSTKSCDNEDEVSLAVMTYLYRGQTWYEKNFDATITYDYIDDLDRIVVKYNAAKLIPWDIMKETIQNNSMTQMTNTELETLYNRTKTWIKFFNTIYETIDIGDFCMFISPWIDKFILKYFNNLQGLNYTMPVKDYNIQYSIVDYVEQVGGKKYTRKIKRRPAKDYQE
jgi:hypothetical protein